jgi:hypothetical protein
MRVVAEPDADVLDVGLEAVDMVERPALTWLPLPTHIGAYSLAVPAEVPGDLGDLPFRRTSAFSSTDSSCVSMCWDSRCDGCYEHRQHAGVPLTSGLVARAAHPFRWWGIFADRL